MGSRPVAYLFVLALAWAGACSTPPEAVSPVTFSISDLPTATATPPEAYGDYLAARYAGLVGDTRAAASYYRQAFDRTPEDPLALDRAIASALIEGDVDSAEALASGADPAVAAASGFAGLVLVVNDVAAGRNRRAMVRLQGLAGDELNASAVRYIGAYVLSEENAEAGLGRLATAPGRALFAGDDVALKGFIHLTAGRGDQALASFEEAWRLGVRLGVVTDTHLRLLAMSGDYDRAAAILAAGAADTGPLIETEAFASELAGGKVAPPSRLTTRQGAGIALYILSSGDLQRLNPQLARIYLHLALKLHPSLDAARLDLARGFSEAERFEDALNQIVPIAASSPYYAAAQAEGGWLLHRLGRNSDALTVAGTLGSMRTGRELTYRLAELYALLERPSLAEGVLSRMIASDETGGRVDWRALFERAKVRERQGLWSDAEADLLRAVELSPDQPEVLNFLGYFWVDRGLNPQDGVRLIRRALGRDPDAPHIIDSLGWALYRQGAFDEAIEELERATGLAPADALIGAHLGDAYWRSGRRREADHEWRRALTLSPTSGLEADLRKRLAEGLPEEDAPVTSGSGRRP
jgi:tetratricopeptide (TPR) repeat protein